MKKMIAIAAVLLAVSVVAFAGLDMYTGKHYTTILAPTSLGVSYVAAGGTNLAVISTAATLTNTAVSLVSYPGQGALVLGVNCGDGSQGVITALIRVCTNVGTVASWTNSDPATSTAQNGWSTNTWTFTGVKTNYVTAFRPNAEAGRVQVYWTATGVTNGNVSAMIVTE